MTFWTVLPIAYETEKKKVAAQSINGRGAYLLIDETSSRLGSVDEDTGTFIDSGIDLKD
eukprot:CAMPEP_0116870376 /NCGR_PEP_ID=MMETSP0463-20121206/259_1 /TAXON_ID=181622 /ORGANISM="Strombidinopsis sp, Strain SopsisLIS2011" /LENGTH=58 /DNA_ID=CAMNT_0004506801 /DNA_START=774 /DNA_END=950 /DNA_ORIENTATION=-